MAFITDEEAFAPKAEVERQVSPATQARRDQDAGATIMSQYASREDAIKDADLIRGEIKRAKGDAVGILTGHLARLEAGLAANAPAGQPAAKPAAKKAPEVAGNFITEEEAFGADALPPKPTLWEKAKSAFQSSQSIMAPVQESVKSGLDQVGKEVKAATNMMVGIPGGVAGVGMDMLSRISSAMYGESPEQAGKTARGVADQVNADWKKVTDTLGLSRDAEGSKIDQLMNWAMEASDKGGAALDKATKGVLSLETTQSVRDTLLNALGVKGMGAIKPRTPPMEMLNKKTGKMEPVNVSPTGDALTPEAQAKAVKPSAPIDTYAPLIEEPAAAPTKAELKAQKAAVDSLVVDPTRLKEMFGIAAKAGPEAEAALVQHIFDRVIKKTEKVERTPEELDAARAKVQAEVDAGITPEPVDTSRRATLLKKDEAVGTVLEKMKDEKPLTAADKEVLHTLEVSAKDGTIKTASGRTVFEKGSADPRLLGVMAALGVTALASPHIADWWNGSSGLSDDKSRDVGLGLAAAGAAGVMKPKGGMWHPRTVTDMAKPLADALSPTFLDAVRAGIRPDPSAVLPMRTWATEKVTNYLNKHAGTATDPIKDVILPNGERWEDLTDAAFGKRAAADYTANGSQMSIRGLTKLVDEGKVKPDEPVYKIGTEYGRQQYGHEGTDVGYSVGAVLQHLEHVGDYVKSLNLTPEELARMDLPRAIKETALNDERIAKLALKDALKVDKVKQADSDTLPVYRSYPAVESGPREFSFNKDGSIRKLNSVTLPAGEVSYSWRELSVPKELTPDQAKRVRRMTREEYAEIDRHGEGEYYTDAGFVALDGAGKPLKDNFGGGYAHGPTPETAHMAGQLVQEGNALGHCVGGYAEQVRGGDTKIYSLRDQQGRSYATVETSPGGAPSIEQIKGPGNGAPADYVKPYIQDFVKGEQWDRVGDAENADLLPLEHGGYVEKSSFDTTVQELRDWFKSTKYSKVIDAYHKAGDKLRWDDPELKRLEKETRQPVGDLNYDATDVYGILSDPLAYGADPVMRLAEATKGMRQAGKADPKLLAGIALGTAAALYLKDNPLDDFTKGALGLIGTVGLTKGRFADMPMAEVIKTYRESTGRSKELAAAKIYEDTHRMLERSIKSWGSDIPAEDIAQVTYMKAFRALDKEGGFMGETEGTAKFSTFLHGIAKNEMRRMYQEGGERMSRRTTPLETPTPEGDLAVNESHTLQNAPDRYKSAYDELANTEAGREMKRAFDKLPEKQQEVFHLIEVEDLDYQTVADQLGIPVGTVRSTLSRAKESMRETLRGYKDKQVGNATTDMMLKTAVIAGGAALGASLADDDSKLSGTLKGAAGGIAAVIAGSLLPSSPKAAVAAIKGAYEGLSKGDTRVRVDDLMNLHEANMATTERAITQQAREVAKIAPKVEQRNLITKMLQAGAIEQLPEALQPAALRAREFFAGMAKAGTEAGVLKDLIDDYVTNLWDLTGANKSKWDEILAAHGGPSMSPESRFALKRKITSLEAGKELGLKPLTEDVGQIMMTYGESLARSIENKALLKGLKDRVDPATGMKMVMQGEKAPHSYVNIDSPQMAGMRVHPDIAPSLSFIFDRNTGGPIKQGLRAFVTATKRSAVMGSLFHAKALLDGFVAAGTANKALIASTAAVGAAYGIIDDKNPVATAAIGAGVGMMLPGTKLIAQAAAPRTFGENIYLKQLKEGHAGDLVDTLLRSGLKVSYEMGKLADEDVGGSFYAGMNMLQDRLNKAMPGLGLPVEGMIKFNKALDTFMWERLHTSMKLTVAAQKLEQLTMNEGKKAAREGRAPREQGELAAEASSFTNDVFGGLNWRRIAEASHTKFGRDVALQVYSPTGRGTMQIWLFAPDWTISTTRAAVQALPGLTDMAHPVQFVQEALKPTHAKGLHGQQLARSALYYLTVANGINFALSGNWIWDNKDWTTIDMGDGRKMQWSKHMMEPVHWVQKPIQQGLNKLGFLPKEVGNQVLGSEYLSQNNNAPRMGGTEKGEDITMATRGLHVLKGLSPITAQGAFGAQASTGAVLSSALGVPIYGKTFDERAEAKRALKELHNTPEYKELKKERARMKKESK